MSASEENKMDQTFRDAISTVDKHGKRVWVYPKKPKGKLFKARTIVSIVLLVCLFTGPFWRIDGEPFLMLNLIDRKFVLLGKVFWPQDFYLFGIAMITFVVFIILFTVVFGRVFCGWVCPQTIFMEMVFRKIEYLIEGDWQKQKALDKAPWTADKIKKRFTKHTIFLFISFVIANTFLAYIIGSEELISIVTDPPGEHVVGLITLLLFSVVFYFVFARFREQVCTVVCPYGRLQGVLLDKNSIIVAYDYIRGEKRGRFNRREDRSATGKGDCVDCHLCVDVCPTGIDIRNGTQLECINCTACIDACNGMMKKVGLPEGLIRYDSEEGIAKKQKFKITTRIIAYSIVLLILLGGLTGFLASRSEVQATLLRTPGMLYQERDERTFSNLYNFKVINKTNKDMDLTFKILSDKGKIDFVGNEVTVKKNGSGEGALFIVLDKDEIEKMKTKIKVGVFSGDECLYTIKTTFIGPVGI